MDTRYKYEIHQRVSGTLKWMPLWTQPDGSSVQFSTEAEARTEMDLYLNCVLSHPDCAYSHEDFKIVEAIPNALYSEGQKFMMDDHPVLVYVGYRYHNGTCWRYRLQVVDGGQFYGQLDEEEVTRKAGLLALVGTRP